MSMADLREKGLQTLRGNDLAQMLWQRGKALLARLRAEPLLRNSMYIMGTNFATAGLGYVFWIIVARTYSAQAVGLASAILSALMLLSALSNFGVGSTLVQMLPRRERGAEWSLTLNAAMAMIIGTGLLAGIIAVIALPLMSSQFAVITQSAPYLLAIIVGVPIITMSVALDQAFIAERAGRHMLTRNVVYSLLKIAVVVFALALLRANAFVIVFAWVASAACATAMAFLLLVPRLKRDYRLSVTGLWARMREMFSSFTGHYFINIGGSLPGYLLPILVTVRVTADANAYFYTVMRVGDFFFMASSAVATALFAEGSHGDSPFARKIRSSAAIAAALFVPALLVCWFGGKYILLVFGPAYAQHGLPLLRIDILSAVPDAITNLYISTLRVRRRLAMAAVVNIGMSALLAILAWILLPRMGIIGAGWAFFLAESVGSALAGLDFLRRRLPPAADSRTSAGHTRSDLPDGAVRVCVVGAGTRFLGGLSYYTLRLTNVLASAHDVSALLMRQILPTRLFPGWRRVGARLTNLEYRADVRLFDGVDWYWLPSMLRAMAWLWNERPQVMLFQWWSGTVLHSYLALELVAKLLKTRVVIEFHEVLDPGEAAMRWASAYTRLIAPLVVGLADAFVLHSEHDANLLHTHYRLSGRPATLIPHGPYDQYQAARAPTPSASDALRTDGPMNLLFFGLIRPYKGLEDLIRAFDALPEAEASAYHLTVVGETWEGWTLPGELIAQSRYRDRITFINRYVADDEVATFFAAADAVVLPYHRASSSGALHIAMSCGLPVVVTRVGGLLEAVSDYDGAILTAPADPAALSAALLEVGRLRGRRFADSHSWDQTIRRYSGLFEKLALTGRRGAAPVAETPGLRTGSKVGAGTES